MNLTSERVVVYISNAMDDRIKHDRCISSDSPAATRKVLSVAKALNGVGFRCIVLSLGRGRNTGSKKLQISRQHRNIYSHLIYCLFWDIPIITHIVTMASLALWVVKLKIVHPGVILLVYNRSYHYCLALLIAKFLRVRAFLDLEDGYILDSNKYIAMVKNNLTRKLFDWLCSDGALLANEGLKRQVGHASTMVCYGVADQIKRSDQAWNSGRIQILFSGTLIREVGCEILISALEILKKERKEIFDEINLVVTGKGPCSQLFEDFAKNSPECMTFYGSLSNELYKDVLRSSHVGMSLRMVGCEMSATTFPSKVVEYAQNGLLVLSTRSSDVPKLFGEFAIYLEDETPYGLAKVFENISMRRAELQHIANLGRDKIFKICDSHKVGIELKSLLVGASS